MSEVSRGKGKGGGRNSEKKEVAAAKGSSAASSKGGSASKGSSSSGKGGSAGKGGGSAGQGETKGRPGGKSEGNVGKSRGKGKSAKGKPSPTELPKVDWEWPTNEMGHPAFAWPPQDPAWWAALASQLPAAWGTGAWGGTSFPEDEAAAKKDEKDVKANLNEEATDKSGAVVPAGKDAKDVTDNLLSALAPSKASTGASISREGKIVGRRWVIAEERPWNEISDKSYIPADQIIGRWVDSQGNFVHVLATDAFEMRLLASLSKPPRPDVHLSVRSIRMGGGWQCGHSILDPSWSTDAQLHWVAGDGKVTVWVRPQDPTKVAPAEDEADKAHHEAALGAALAAAAAAPGGQDEEGKVDETITAEVSDQTEANAS